MIWDDIYKGTRPRPDFGDHDKKTPSSNIFGVNMLSRHLYAAGGPAQQSRMIKDKRRTLDRAVLYSYQGAFIKKYIPEETETVYGERENIEPVRALINPNKLKQDYDDKILSVGYEHNFQPGDIFEWCQTGTYWLIYLQDLTELAYFRGDIRKCSYQINWVDEEGNEKSTFAATRGPVETKINYIQKHQISVDTPNFSLNLLLPLNSDTEAYFNRYSKFYIQNDSKKVCWRVEAIDWLSTPGILEVQAVEYYANEAEDDIESGLVGVLKTKEIDPNADDSLTIISGETFIKPKKEYTYVCNKRIDGKWGFDKKYPVEIVKVSKNARGRSEVIIKWTSTYSGQFELCFGDYTKTIVVESLF